MDRTMGCLDWIWVREWWCIGKGTLRGFGGLRWIKLRLTWCGFADCPAVSGRWTDSPPVPPWCCDGECCFDYGGARCSEFQFEKHQCLCILALRGKRDFRSWVEDPKQCPPKQHLLLSPLWQLKFFSPYSSSAVRRHMGKPWAKCPIFPGVADDKRSKPGLVLSNASLSSGSSSQLRV